MNKLINKNNIWVTILMFVVLCGLTVLQSVQYENKKEDSIAYIDKVFKEEGAIDNLGSFTSYNNINKTVGMGHTEGVIETYTALENSGYDALSDNQKIVLFEDQPIGLLGLDKVSYYESIKPTISDLVILQISKGAVIIGSVFLFFKTSLYKHIMLKIYEWVKEVSTIKVEGNDELGNKEEKNG